jgi:hypothetical protein
VLRIAPTTAFQFLTNDEFKQFICHLSGKTHNQLGFAEHVAAGSLAGATASIIVYPLDLIRVCFSIAFSHVRSGVAEISNRQRNQLSYLVNAAIQCSIW